LALSSSSAELGGHDVIGMNRINIHIGSSPVEEDHWKEAVQDLLDVSVCVLLQPDTTAGVDWEISEISRRGMIDRTIFIMLPLSVDGSAADRKFEGASPWACCRFAGLSPGGGVRLSPNS
jgi:hypothetical protein